MSLTGNSHPIVIRGSRVSRVSPHHNLLASLNLHGGKQYLQKIHKLDFIYLKNVSIAKHFRKNEVAEFQISFRNSNGPRRLLSDRLAHDLSVSAFQYR